MDKLILYIVVILIVFGCKSEKKGELVPIFDAPVEQVQQVNIDEEIIPEPKVMDYDTTRWVELTNEDIGIAIDIRYATEDNFMKQKVYDCGRCFLEPRLAERVNNIAQELYIEKGYGLKLYDCYRPRGYQQRLWDIKPDARYVTPPKRGSYHSRGLSVDLTIVDDKGQILDMGTPYDSFSKLSHTNHRNLPDEVLANRDLLKGLMNKQGLKGIRTEWWHYSLYDKKIPLEEWIWNCN